MHAVAEAARKVAMTGATPVAATNCLNFGNPEKPRSWRSSPAAIDGIAEACTALGTPITGGNVSLYNETRGEGIYPTPVLGIVGILDDVTKAVPADFQHERDAMILLWPIPRGEEPDPNLKVPLNPPPISQYPLPVLEREPRGRAEARRGRCGSCRESNGVRVFGVRQGRSRRVSGAVRPRSISTQKPACTSAR